MINNDAEDYFSVSITQSSNKRERRSLINKCPDNCNFIGNWTSLDTNDGTGDHENFPLYVVIAKTSKTFF